MSDKQQHGTRQPLQKQMGVRPAAEDLFRATVFASCLKSGDTLDRSQWTKEGWEWIVNACKFRRLQLKAKAQTSDEYEVVE